MTRTFSIAINPPTRDKTGEDEEDADKNRCEREHLATLSIYRPGFFSGQKLPQAANERDAAKQSDRVYGQHRKSDDNKAALPLNYDIADQRSHTDCRGDEPNQRALPDRPISGGDSCGKKSVGGVALNAVLIFEPFMNFPFARAPMNFGNNLAC